MSSYDNKSRFPSPWGSPERHDLTLCPADAAAVDELLGGATDSAAAVDPARRARVQQWLAVLAVARPALPPSDLVARTLQAVQDDAARPPVFSVRPWAEISAPGWRFGRQFGEFAAMALAASVLLAVLIPGLGSARQSAERATCASNLAALGGGLDRYAADEHNALPSLPLTADTNWLPHEAEPSTAGAAGSGHSNTANLLPMLRREGSPALVQRLVCPARGTNHFHIDLARDEIPDTIRGYSYVNLFGAVRPTWDGQPSTLVLADRNPLFTDSAVRDPHANSLNHSLHGTNVLAADRSVLWSATPDIGPAGDNIWTIRDPAGPRLIYTGHETSADLTDVFLSP